MVLILPPVESFGTQFAKALGSSAGQGIGNSPNMLMELLKQKRERQAQAGETAVNIASKVNPDLKLEDMEEIFTEGSKLGDKNKSPVELYRDQIEGQVKRKNKLRNVGENIAPDTLWQKITHIGENASDRAFKDKELKKELEGFSKSKKRDLLKKKFGAEEIEQRVSPLSPETSEFMSSFPSLIPEKKRKNWLNPKEDIEAFSERINGHPLNEPQKEYLSKHLSELFKDPDANPLLLRRDLENKGVGWRDFRDILDNLQESGQIDLSQNKDYEYQKSFLSKPPLGYLDKALHNLKIIGR